MDDSFGVNPRTLGPYTSRQTILFVGEADFTLARAVANALGGERIIATSLEPFGELCKKYSKAPVVISHLKTLKATVVHGVDATRLHAFPQLPRSAIMRVVFFFPHVGGGSLQSECAQEHQTLLREFFRSCRDDLTHPALEVHVALRNTVAYRQWGIADVAEAEGWSLKRSQKLDTSIFPGYTPQRTHPHARAAPDANDATLSMFVRANPRPVANADPNMLTMLSCLEETRRSKPTALPTNTRPRREEKEKAVAGVEVAGEAEREEGPGRASLAKASSPTLEDKAAQHEQRETVLQRAILRDILRRRRYRRKRAHFYAHLVHL
eukprot:CAMPEP_0177648146 /NCGR_PEP_ID=MMETSP0447-20121125/10675_1 /TAXON_ID=0 /ORGANISM="Stygamoeba regulata, Strain BSH-02190019" /LENGTH=322 /DNA_ID=CAMNT_0019150773 /DNA_START=244 /DNA_END=1212 /DNA_ORIENTATION=+